MIDKINIASTSSPVSQSKTGDISGAADVSKGFGSFLNDALNQLSSQETAVHNLNEQFIKGEATDIHQLMIHSEKLSLGLELTVQVRNKVIEVYQDVMRMQI